MPEAQCTPRIDWTASYVFEDDDVYADLSYTVNATVNANDDCAALRVENREALFNPNDFSAFVDRLVQFRDEHVKPLMQEDSQ